jgi:hypothetical protein
MGAPFVFSALRPSSGNFFDVEIAVESFADFFDRFIGGIKLHARRPRRYVGNAVDPGRPLLPSRLDSSYRVIQLRTVSSPGKWITRYGQIRGSLPPSAVRCGVVAVEGDKNPLKLPALATGASQAIG